VQDLAVLLAREVPLRARLEGKSPTGALATIVFRRVGWENLDRGKGELVGFVVPAAGLTGPGPRPTYGWRRRRN
jgi:hypothetical protein